MNEDEKQPAMRRRGIYLLPNLFTTAGLFAGFYAIIAAMSHDFENAAVAIFVAMLMDGIDGRVARLTNTQSAFGVQYDSLSDMVCFGLAPALVIFQWALRSMIEQGWIWSKLGWLAAFVYTAGAALRLARFNTQIGIADKRYFQGLPSPSAAAVVAGLVYVHLPFMVLPLYASLERMYWSYIEASLDLGAGHLRTFVSVVIPLAMPGIVTGIIITFVPALGSFLTPDLLGGTDSQMIANVIERQFKSANDWPFGAALSFLLMYVTFFAIALRALWAGRRQSGAAA